MQGKNGNKELENRLVDPVWEEESGMSGQSNINIYALLGVGWIAYDKLLCREPSLELCDNL